MKFCIKMEAKNLSIFGYSFLTYFQLQFLALLKNFLLECNKIFIEVKFVSEAAGFLSW